LTPQRSSKRTRPAPSKKAPGGFCLQAWLRPAVSLTRAMKTTTMPAFFAAALIFAAPMVVLPRRRNSRGVKHPGGCMIFSESRFPLFRIML
jgi:hypothetical protein